MRPLAHEVSERRVSRQVWSGEVMGSNTELALKAGVTSRVFLQRRTSSARTRSGPLACFFQRLV